MARRTLLALALLLCALLASTTAQAESTARAKVTRTKACVNKPYSYAGLQSEKRAHGVAATIVATASPFVPNGHVGGWIGVGGPNAGPGGVAQWLQVGLAAFTADTAPRLYYEVTLAGKRPHYVELRDEVRPGTRYRLSVLEIPGRASWWRVRVNGRSVSPPIHLPGSHGRWYPQAMSENWNGGNGTCNGFRFRFADVKVQVAAKRGSKPRLRWQPIESGYVWEDAGYKLLRTPGAGFVATSL